MKYNDFQIFDESVYSALNTKYKESEFFNRKTIVTKLYLELLDIVFLCTAPSNYNKLILNNLLDLKNCTNKLIDNLKANFSFANINNTFYKNCNIFKIIKKITNCLNLCNIWQKQEDKKYYKNIIFNFSNSLISKNINLLSCLENSYIKFFKYM